jgi:hypothetical protein
MLVLRRGSLPLPWLKVPHTAKHMLADPVEEARAELSTRTPGRDGSHVASDELLPLLRRLLPSLRRDASAPLLLSVVVTACGC